MGGAAAGGREWVGALTVWRGLLRMRWRAGWACHQWGRAVRDPRRFRCAWVGVMLVAAMVQGVCVWRAGLSCASSLLRAVIMQV